MQAQEYILFNINKQNAQETINFAAKNYTSNQLLSLHRKVTAQDFKQAYKNLLQKCCESGFSFGFKFQQQIVSVILITHYDSYNEHIQVSDKLKPIQIMIQTLQDMYKPEDIQKAISIFIVCTHPQHTRKGLMNKLTTIAQQQISKKGFKQIIADCTSQKSKRAFEKLGYKEQSRIVYADFQFQNTYPFKDIQNCDHLALMIKKFVF